MHCSTTRAKIHYSARPLPSREISGGVGVPTAELPSDGSARPRCFLEGKN